jgi:predicted PurR-regulated permease PerM
MKHQLTIGETGRKMNPGTEITLPDLINEHLPESDSAPWSAWIRRLVGVIVILAILIGLLLAGTIYGQVVAALALCLFLFVPLRTIMRGTHLNYLIAMLLTFVGYLIISVVLFILLAAPFLDLVSKLLEGADRFLDEAAAFTENYTPGSAVISDSAGNIILDLDSVIRPFLQNAETAALGRAPVGLPNLSGILASSIGAVFGFGGGLVSFAYNLFFVNLLALFFLAELPNFYRWMMRSLSSPSKRQLGVLLARFDSSWTGYLRGAAVISVLGAVLTWILLTLMGIPNAVGVAFITTVLLLVPFFGPLLGSATCFVAALAFGSTAIDQSPLVVAIIAAVLFLFMRGFVVGNVVYPRVVGKSVGVPGVIVLIAIPFFGALGGILGMFLSPVLAAVIIDLGVFVYAKMNNREPFPNDPLPWFMFNNALQPRVSHTADTPLTMEQET